MAYVSATKGPIPGGSTCLATSEEVRNSLSCLSERGTREAWRERPTIMRAVMRWEDTAGHRSRTQTGRVAVWPLPPHGPKLAGLGAWSQSWQREPCRGLMAVLLSFTGALALKVHGKPLHPQGLTPGCILSHGARV